MISGVLFPCRGTSTTIGPEFSGARVLGARLLLRALDGAIDILLLFLSLRVGEEKEERLDDDDDDDKT